MQNISRSKPRMFEYGSRIDEVFHLELLDAVRTDGVVFVRRFPCSEPTFVRFARALGRPQPATTRDPSSGPADFGYWVGNMNAHIDERWWGALLPLHTAGANSPSPPRLHAMLMIQSGIDGKEGDRYRGQSLFSRLGDAIVELIRSDPRNAEQYLRTLLETPVTTDYVASLPPRSEPFLKRQGEDAWTFRYWIEMAQYARRDGWRQDQLDALAAFDVALNRVRFEHLLELGDLVVLDNHRVAHGRMPFPSELVDEFGVMTPNPRRVVNIHISSDL